MPPTCCSTAQEPQPLSGHPSPFHGHPPALQSLPWAPQLLPWAPQSLPWAASGTPKLCWGHPQALGKAAPIGARGTDTVPPQEQAFESSQKYKEGKFIIEMSHMVKENGWD